MSAENILCPVRTNAERFPDSPALITRERTWGWGELDEFASSAAAHLYEVAPSGSRIAVQMPNSSELIALILAALRTGHILVPISTRLPAVAAKECISSIGAIEVEGADDSWLTANDNSTTLTPPPLHPFAQGDTPIPLNRPATIIHTSGSMGTPKAALHAVGNHIWSARGLAEVIPLNPDDRWLLNLPLYHSGGLAIVFRCALAGAAIVLPNAGTGIGESIEALGVTHASLVNTQLYRLLGEEGTNFGFLKAVLLGGSAIPSALLDEARARGLSIHPSYGLTEMASTVSVAPHADHHRSSGSILPYREVDISDGEIHVRGRTLFEGYVEGDQLVHPFDEDGWFATGDLGLLDEQGFLHVTGRKDNRFVSGGESIQPEEIEAALNALDGVIRAVVVPVADEEFGHRPVAFAHVEGALDPKVLRNALESALPRFKLPVAIYPWPEFGGMKPNRATLRKEAERV